MLHRASFARLALCTVMVLTIPGWAQHKDKKPDKKQPPPAASEDQVAPDDFVVLVTGACQPKPDGFSVRDCIRGVTRQEFEELLSLENVPDPSPQARERFAQQLGELIIISNEAKKRDLPKDPAVQELMKFAGMQALARVLLNDTMKKEVANPTDAEVEAYYQAHLADFKKAEFLRISVPLKGPAATPEEQQFADSIRTRCAAGEDPAKLQADADHHAGLAVSPPAHLQNQTPSGYPATQRSMFEMKTGECSGVIPAMNQLLIYKMAANSTPLLAEVRPTVVSSLENTKIKASVDQLNSATVISLNKKYFEPAQKSQDKK